MSSSSSCTQTMQECCKRFRAYYPFIRLTTSTSNIIMDSTCALFCRVDGVKMNEDGIVDVYVNDGCYGGLSPIMTTYRPPEVLHVAEFGQLSIVSARHMTVVSKMAPTAKKTKIRSGYHSVRLWGQTCDSYDKICDRLPLETIPEVGEWMRFVGSSVINTSPASQTSFNGFQPADRYYFIQLK